MAEKKKAVADEKQQKKNGVLIRGADGEYYWIPQAALGNFHVSQEDEERIRRFVPEEQVKEFSKSARTPSGFKKAGQVGSLLAVYGPLEDENIVASSESPTVSHGHYGIR